LFSRLIGSVHIGIDADFAAIIDSPAGQVTLGASVPNGLEQKGIDTITSCIKKCVSAGAGIPAVVPVGIALVLGKRRYYYHNHRGLFQTEVVGNTIDIYIK